MASFTYQYVVNNLNKLLNQMDAGTLASIEIIHSNTDEPVVEAKIIPYSQFSVLAPLSTVIDRLDVPQMAYASHPMRLGVNSLYKTIQGTKKSSNTFEAGGTRSTLTTYRSGPDGIDFTAKVPGTSGDALEVEVLTGSALSVVQSGDTLSITLDTGVTTFAEIVVAVNALSTAKVTAAGVGTQSTVAIVFAATALSGGADPTVSTKYSAFAMFRTKEFTNHYGVTPVTTPRAVLISKALADHLGV